MFGVFPKPQGKKIKSLICKCIHVTFLPVFNSASCGMAFCISYTKKMSEGHPYPIMVIFLSVKQITV